jgi:hypothetical protein
MRTWAAATAVLVYVNPVYILFSLSHLHLTENVGFSVHFYFLLLV